MAPDQSWTHQHPAYLTNWVSVRKSRCRRQLNAQQYVLNLTAPHRFKNTIFEPAFYKIDILIVWRVIVLWQDTHKNQTGGDQGNSVRFKPLT